MYGESTKIAPNIQNSLHALLQQYPLVQTIVVEIDRAGGRALLVGGAVRDLLLGIQAKDIDIEVHGLAPDVLETLLRQFGPVSLVGKVFGVFRVHGLDTDWSLPRRDTAGRKPEVVVDPNLSIEDAFRRRDLTMNAMGIDLITHELIDPFGGQKDLHEGILRTPDAHFFVQDPLRFYRVMQFIARFNMIPDEQLKQICTTMDITGVSVERIETEMHKMMLRSQRPSLGLRWLHEIERLHEVLPELAETIGIPQDKRWHPEGDVYEHSLQALDAAARFEYEDSMIKLIIMYAALCHDIGKTTTTEHVGDTIRSYGHAQEGAKMAKIMLKRITRNTTLIDAVVKLVNYHMDPMQLVAANSSLAAYKRMAAKLAPEVTMAMMADLCLVDKQGRNDQSHEPLTERHPDIDQFLENARAAHVVFASEPPVLLGRDLMDTITPGPEMGKLLKQAYTIQIDEGIQDVQELKRRVLKKK